VTSGFFNGEHLERLELSVGIKEPFLVSLSNHWNGPQLLNVGARHRFSLEIAFWLQKTTSKLSNDAFYFMFCCQIKDVALVRPGRPAGPSFEWVTPFGRPQ